jgi:hypothetical protein
LCPEVTVRITRWDGLIDVEQAAELCGVKPVTVRAWTQRGYGPKDARGRLPVAKREGLNSSCIKLFGGGTGCTREIHRLLPNGGGGKRRPSLYARGSG